MEVCYVYCFFLVLLPCVAYKLTSYVYIIMFCCSHDVYLFMPPRRARAVVVRGWK